MADRGEAFTAAVQRAIDARAEQGLPRYVEDPKVLAQLAVLLKPAERAA